MGVPAHFSNIMEKFVSMGVPAQNFQNLAIYIFEKIYGKKVRSATHEKQELDSTLWLRPGRRQIRQRRRR